jgi:DNA-directed RNA polymerase specialized sigma24 family protein
MHKSGLDPIENEAFAMWKGGASIEESLHFLCSRGFNQPRSVDALVAIAGLDRSQAQTAVLVAGAWRDQYERNLLIQQELEQALIQLSQEDNELVIERSYEELSEMSLAKLLGLTISG